MVSPPRECPVPGLHLFTYMHTTHCKDTSQTAARQQCHRQYTAASKPRLKKKRHRVTCTSARLRVALLLSYTGRFSSTLHCTLQLEVSLTMRFPTLMAFNTCGSYVMFDVPHNDVQLSALQLKVSLTARFPALNLCGGYAQSDVLPALENKCVALHCSWK